MQNLFHLNNNIINSTEDYVYCGSNHSLFLAHSYIQENVNIKGLVSVNENDNGKFALGLPIVSIQSLVGRKDVCILILDNQWQEHYDLVAQYMPFEQIYVNYLPWVPMIHKCVACENDKLFAGYASFVDFLKLRMFDGQDKSTMLMHCPKCGMYFSHYRPNDEEMDKLYYDYRGKSYFEQRNSCEPHYTWELNNELTNPADGGAKRMGNMTRFISQYVNMGEMKMLLDYGGDKGQYIPKEFYNADKYVYEISHPSVVEGVSLIEDKIKLYEYSWDMILCNQVMEHLSDVKNYFRELVSHMDMNTFLYIEVPYERWMVDSDCSGIHEHINSFTPTAFEKLAQANGIQMIGSEVYDEIIRCIFKR